jgi:chitinase
MKRDCGSFFPHLSALALAAIVSSGCSDPASGISNQGSHRAGSGNKAGASDGGFDPGVPSNPDDPDAGCADCGATDTPDGGSQVPAPGKPMPKHALIGYWHNFSNPSGPAFPIGQVSDDWDVIDVAFAMNAQPSGSVAFQLDSALNEEQFKSDIAAKRAAGKKVVLSLGGQDGTVSLNTASDVENFVSSLTAIIKTYGFDGVDIDLETGAGITQGAPVQTNLVAGIKRIKANTLGAGFYLSMAPEHPYVQGAFAANAGIWGSYLPIIEGLRDDLTVLHVQLYNDGDMPTPWGTVRPATEDLMVASVDMLLGGFQPASGPAFKPLRADQVAFGVPSGNSSANPGNFASEATLEAAYMCITAGTSCAAHTPSKTYPDFRGVMTWSINWDKHDGAAAFSQPLAKFLHEAR